MWYSLPTVSQVDLLPFLSRYPAVLGAEVKDIEPKVDYLFQTLGGSQEMLRRFPSFLSFDLEAHTRPRAEFLRALKIDPLINGLAFLVNAPPKEIAYTAGVRVELFNQFQCAYAEMWKKKALKEKQDNDNSVFVRKDIKLKQEQFSNWIEDNLNPVDKLLDELDFSF
jgi:mTERF